MGSKPAYHGLRVEGLLCRLQRAKLAFEGPVIARISVAETCAPFYPMMQTTTPVAVEGGVAGGALPMSARTSFHGRRKPNGSAFHRRVMAAVQDAAKRAISALSALESALVEKAQPHGKM